MFEISRLLMRDAREHLQAQPGGFCDVRDDSLCNLSQLLEQMGSGEPAVIAHRFASH